MYIVKEVNKILEQPNGHGGYVNKRTDERKAPLPAPKKWKETSRSSNRMEDPNKGRKMGSNTGEDSESEDERSKYTRTNDEWARTNDKWLEENAGLSTIPRYISHDESENKIIVEAAIPKFSLQQYKAIQYDLRYKVSPKDYAQGENRCGIEESEDSENDVLASRYDSHINPASHLNDTPLAPESNVYKSQPSPLALAPNLNQDSAARLQDPNINGHIAPQADGHTAAEPQDNDDLYDE